jgi:hypothetical protein
MATSSGASPRKPISPETTRSSDLNRVLQVSGNLVREGLDKVTLESSGDAGQSVETVPRSPTRLSRD